MLNSGADKIAINSAAIASPFLLNNLADKFGSSTISLQLDAKRRQDGWEALCGGSRQATGRCAIEWAQEAVKRGVGEILVTAIDRQGTTAGPDIPLLDALAGLPVPVVLAGGITNGFLATACYRRGASGVAVSNTLHADPKAALLSMKATLGANCVPIRNEFV